MNERLSETDKTRDEWLKKHGEAQVPGCGQRQSVRMYALWINIRGQGDGS
jgi:hypothetical protein